MSEQKTKATAEQEESAGCIAALATTILVLIFAAIVAIFFAISSTAWQTVEGWWYQFVYGFSVFPSLLIMMVAIYVFKWVVWGSIQLLYRSIKWMMLEGIK